MEKDNYVITIARGMGSGGRMIGKRLSEQLHIGYYDRELLKLAAESSGMPEDIFRRADEKVVTPSLQRVTRNIYRGGGNMSLLPSDRIFQYQSQVLLELAKEESFVVIGRCADYVLREENVLRVFVYAPLEYCIANMKVTCDMEEAQARDYIIETDEKRAEYYKRYTGKDWYDARNYDLCLNSEQLGYEKCVDVIKEYIYIQDK